MLIRRAPRFTASEITDPTLYLSRRELISGAAAALVLAPGLGEAATPAPPALQALSATRHAAFSLTEPLTKVEAATTYNNFYEFGVNKDDPSRLGHTLKPRPWTVHVDGFVSKPKTFDVDELMRLFPLEERVYSLRCVEAWSMVIPWIGFPLAPLLKRVEPTGQAKYVEFTTLLDPNQFPAQKPGFFGFSSLDWPYVEGLRLDEAMHPLTLLTVGMYGKVLPNQNGARPDPSGERAAQDRLGEGRAPGVRLLLQRQSRRQPSALEPGRRAPYRGIPPAADASVQRLRRPGRGALHRDGPEEELLV